MKGCMRFLGFDQLQEQIFCNSKSQLTYNHFVDPYNPKDTEISILCQIHRDEIIRPILRPYMIKVNEIETEKAKIKKNTRKLRSMDTSYDGIIKERIEKLYAEKRNISFNSCRDLLCNSEREYHKPLNFNAVFTLLSFGQNGKLAHSFYFHEDCWNRVKRIFGLTDYSRKPENQKMEQYLNA